MSASEWIDDYLRDLTRRYGSYKIGLEVEGGIFGAIDYFNREELPNYKRHLDDIVKIKKISVDEE